MTDTKALAGRLRKALYGIQDNYDDTLQPATRTTGTHAINQVNPPLPIPADTLDKRALTCIRLTSWTLLVITNRDLHVNINAGDVHALTALLITHCDWLADQPSGPQAAAQLEASAADLGEIAADNAPHRFKVGTCPAPDCAGVLRVVLRRDDDLLPSELRCTLHPVEHVWAAGEWRVLDRLINGGLVRYEEAARRLAAAIGSP